MYPSHLHSRTAPRSASVTARSLVCVPESPFKEAHHPHGERLSPSAADMNRVASGRARGWLRPNASRRSPKPPASRAMNRKIPAPIRVLVSTAGLWPRMDTKTLITIKPARPAAINSTMPTAKPTVVIVSADPSRCRSDSDAGVAAQALPFQRQCPSVDRVELQRSPSQYHRRSGERAPMDVKAVATVQQSRDCKPIGHIHRRDYAE